MPISGLVVTLVDDRQSQLRALDILNQYPAIDVGEPSLGRVPIVVETSDADEDRLVWEWLHAIPGVAVVVVAFIHFDDDESEAGLPYSAAGCRSDQLSPPSEP
jgi:hypothetical protein